jgi:hypothetical protein
MGCHLDASSNDRVLTDSIRKSLAETIQQLKLCGAELQQIRVLNMVKTRRNWNQT